jgi:hypothetical protein
VLLGAASTALACGFHDDVSIARGALNWVYPDALHVIGASARAVAEGRLPPPGPARGGFGPGSYHGTVRSLERFALQLRSPSREAAPALALVLVEPMLWTRYVPDGGDLRSEVHVVGPEAGDLVMVAGEAVLHEIAGGRLALEEAHRLGLVRLYGTDEQTAPFLIRYGKVGGPPTR